MQAPVTERPVALPPVTRERDVWMILFVLALVAVTCFAVAAVDLTYSKYLRGFSG
jgi:hypothetical protein